MTNKAPADLVVLGLIAFAWVLTMLHAVAIWRGA